MESDEPGYFTSSSNERGPEWKLQECLLLFCGDGSFFKLKNLHFGYNLPKSILSHLKIEGLKFYINCDNLFIITKFQGDPELGGGYLERNMYSVKRAPSTRTIMGGLSLTL